MEALTRAARDVPRLVTIRLASVPAGHPYVRAVTADPAVSLLADPPVAGAPPSQWWPPVVLDASWIREHAHQVDLLHLHFGTESYPVDHVRYALDAAHAAGWPVVVTVHDIEHPQLRDQGHYVAQLGVLLELADAVVTLTPGAADEIWRRWGRDAAVVPHPRILQRGWTTGPVEQGAPRRPRIATHLKDLRPSIDPLAAVHALAGLAGDDLDVEVHLRDRTRDDRVADEVRALCAASSLTLVEHARLSDDELAAHLAGLDACLLPYRHGTHSGWLELCWDLGVPVVAPAVGHLSEQHPDGSVLPVPALDQPGAIEELREAVAAALMLPAAGTPARAALVDDRARRRLVSDQAAVDAHRELYRRLVGARR